MLKMSVFHDWVPSGLQFDNTTTTILTDRFYHKTAQQQRDEKADPTPDRAPYWANALSRIQVRCGLQASTLPHQLSCCITVTHMQDGSDLEGPYGKQLVYWTVQLKERYPLPAASWHGADSVLY